MPKYKAGDVVLIEAVIGSVYDDRKHRPHIYTIKIDANLGIGCRYTNCTEESIIGLKNELQLKMEGDAECIQAN